MTAVPAPLGRESGEPPAPTPAPITCAGIAAHESGVRYIRLDPDTLQALCRDSRRSHRRDPVIYRQPHHDLRARRPARRAALRVRRGRMDDDQLRRRADAGRRRLSLSRRHFQRQAHPVVRNGAPVHRRPARAVVAEPHRLPHRAIPRRRRNRDLHSAHHRLHRPQSAAAPRRLRSRRLRDELGTVAERLRFARGLVYGKLLLALDPMAILHRGAGHVRMHLVRSAAREDQLGPAARSRLARTRLFRDRVLSALRRP